MGLKAWAKRAFGIGDQGYTYTGDGTRGRFHNASTLAGPTINEETALTIPAFFHGMRLYGQTLGMLDWDVVKLDPKKKTRTIATDHPLYWLLHHEPNEFQTASEFRETIIGAHAMPYGNGFAYIARNGNFRPTALLPLMPDRTKPIRIGGELKYQTIVNGQTITLEPYEVFHVKGFGGNGVTGFPLVQIMKHTLGLSKAEEMYAAQFFGNGANIGGIVEVAGTLDEAAQKNLKNSMAESYGGLHNAFKILFLEEGMKFTAGGAVDPERAQMVESRSYQLGDMARIVGLAPHLLYDLSKSTNNNIEHQGIEAVTYSFKPWAVKICQEANRKCLYESEKGLYETQLDLKPLMAGDATSQAAADQILFNTSSITPNEIRAKRGLNPIDGGDQLFVNLASLPLSLAVEKAKADIYTALAAATPEDKAKIEATESTGEPQDAPQPASNPNSAIISDPDGEPGPDAPAKLTEDIRSAAVLAPIVNDSLARLLRREEKAIRSAVKKHADDPEAFGEWFTTYQQDTRSIVAETLQPIAATVAAMTGRQCDIAGIVEQFIGRTKSDIQSAFESEARSAAIDMCVSAWPARAEDMTAEILEDDD